MPCLSGHFNPQLGPLVNIGIVPHGTFNPALPTQSIQAFPALIDTGATSTCISPTIVQALALSPVGKRPMTSATHSIPVNVYVIDLIFPFGQAAFHLPAMQVMEFAMGIAGSFQMPLGRDIICQGHLTMSFDGHFTFSL